MAGARNISTKAKRPQNDRSAPARERKIRLAKFVIFAAILSYLTYQLSKIGWSEIVQALPTSPLFYLLSIGFVAAPVMAEILVFQTLTRRKPFRHFRLFLRKHVLNKAVINFSGDAYFIQTLSKQPGLDLRKAAIIMKDMTLLRIFSANVWTVILALSVILFGNFDVLRELTATSPGLVIAASAFCLTLCSAGMLFFRKLTSIRTSTALKVISLYVTRALIVAMILVTQWSIAIPGNEISTWFIFLIIFMFAKKSPVGGELLFASIIVSLPILSGDSAAIAAMLLAIAAITQVIYLLGFVLTLQRSKAAKPMCAPSAGPETADDLAA